jgi:glutathione S-transferase
VKLCRPHSLAGQAAQKKFQPMIDVHLDFIEKELSQRPGSPVTNDGRKRDDELPAEAARSRAGLGSSRPATVAWLAKVHVRPAYQRALAAGGPYAYA